MGLMDDILASDAVNAFLDTDGFAESVTYISRTGATRPIGALVDRKPPLRVSGDGNTFAYALEIEVANSSTRGIALSELNNGGAKVRVAYREGGTAQDFLIIKEPLSQDAGMLRLALNQA
jgi:hypothetical protein